MAGLVQATAVTATDGGLVAEVDPAWDIWGPAGGYIAAIALSAVRTRAQAEHRPVSMTGQFIGVARPGLLDVTVVPVKTGGTELFAVALAQEGRRIFHAQIWTSSRREDSLSVAPTMPAVPPFNALRDWTT